MTQANIRRRSDSSAHAIAAELEAAYEAGAARSARRRSASMSRIASKAGASTAVGHYTIPRSARRPDDVASDGHALTAAAQIVSGDAVVNKQKGLPKQAWQKESWELRDEVGEFRFSGDRYARAVSLCRLYVAKIDGAEGTAGSPPAATAEDLGGDPYVLGRDLFGTKAQMQQAMKRAGQHLAFNGESLLVVSHTEEDGYSWTPYSTTELMQSAGSGWKLADGLEDRDLTVDELVIRAWQPHPERAGFADCAARSVLPVVRELKGLTQHVAAQIDSRLAGAGVLWVPDSIEVLGGQAAVELVENPEDPNGPLIPAVPVEGNASSHPFVDALSEYMTVPIKDRGSAAAVVPLVVKVPKEALADIQHMLFGGNLDDKATALRDEAIRRLALGMDSAPEVLLGLGSANHWSAWQVTEEEVTLHVGPGAATICHALTSMWLRPALEQLGHSPEDAASYQIWFDASSLQLRPDRSKDAQALFDKGELSAEALLRENGFDSGDVPTDEEKHRRVLTALLASNPALAPAILPQFGITLDWSLLAASAPAPASGGEGEPVPVDDNPLPVPGGDPAPADRGLPERSNVEPAPEEVPAP